MDTREPPTDLDLIAHLDEVLAEPHPLPLLEYASGLLHTLERNDAAIAWGHAQEPAVERDELIASFREVGPRQTDGLLLALAPMLGDDALAQRIRGEVASRKRPLPGWLRELESVRPTATERMRHVLGDGENFIVGVDLPRRRQMTLVFYVDHNVGTIVKDGYALDRPFDEVSSVLEAQHAEDGDMIHERISLADARAFLQEAVEHGRRVIPPFVTDSWPMSRPLAEWILRLLPEGGSGYTWIEPDAEQIAEYVERFLSSEPARAVLRTAATGEVRDIAESLCWFAGGFGSGDPLRWSPVSVEILLTDWVPRKVAADAAYLELYPAVTRAFVRFAHAERGIAPALTLETLENIDAFEPEFRELIATPRRTGPEAILERMGALPPLDDEFSFGGETTWDKDDPFAMPRWSDDPSPGEFARRLVAQAVGGDEALAALSDEPLPSEVFDPAALPEGARTRAAEIASAGGAAAAELFGDEMRTALNRILTDAFAADPSLFARGRVDTAAAAALWVAAKVNGEFAYGGGVRVADVAAAFDLKSLPTQRAHSLLAAFGVRRPEWWSVRPVLLDARYLTSDARADLLRRLEDTY